MCYQHGFHRNINDNRINHVINANSKEEALKMGTWDRIKDFFCSHKKAEALSHLYELTRDINLVENSSAPVSHTIDSAFEKMEAFYALRQLTGDAHKDRLVGRIAKEENGTFTFNYKISKDADISINYGDFLKEEDAILNLELANSSQFLPENDSVVEALKKVSYDIQSGRYTGMPPDNQERLSTHLLTTEAKQAMTTQPELAQSWIEKQMKCFDFFASRRSRIEQMEGVDISEVIDTDDAWILDAAQSISSLHNAAHEYFAGQTNHKLAGNVTYPMV